MDGNSDTASLTRRDAQAGWFIRWRPTISVKLGLFFAVFMLATYANIHIAASMFDSLGSSAHIVNETGRLRYLSQKIAYLATRLDVGDRLVLRGQIEEYARVLSGINQHLETGGRPLLEQSPELRGKLDGLRAQWSNYARVVSIVVASDLADRQAREHLHALADSMLADADEIVNALTETDAQVRRRVHRQLDGLLALEAFFLLLVFLFIQRGVSRPIRHLAQLCQSFASGNHAVRMEFHSRDEVGDLARSFNRTAEITSALIHELNERTKEATLLHRVAVVLQEDGPVVEVAGRIARLLPEGWQFSEIAEARVVCGEAVARTAEFRATPWCIRAELAAASGAQVIVEVCYREARPTAAEGPFLAEERQMIDDVARMLKSFIDKMDARHAQQRLLSILESTTDLVVTFYPDGRIFYLNQAARRLFGIDREDEVGTIIARFPPWVATQHLQQALPSATESGSWSGEIAVLDRRGQEIPMSQALIAHRDTHGAIAYFSAIARDITERKRLDAELEKLANHDSLTGLPNRSLLNDRIAQALAFARRQHCRAAVMFIDLDRFKTVNDTLGHDTGDRLLVAVASRLHACLREGDTVARIGGDEFVVVLPDIGAIGDNVAVGGVDEVADKLMASLAAPFRIEGHELFVTCSLGISIYPRDGEDIATLLKHADVAMYRAKEEGRNTRQYFAAEMNIRAHERLTLENSLRHALEREEFVLHYQPQIELASGRIVGMEALLRWRHPELGMVSPADFIPLAEETGLIVPIGEWVLRSACAQNRAWQIAGLPPLRIAVNFSARQFRQVDLVGLVSDALAVSGLAAAHLDVELTESMLMQGPEQVIDTLQRLKAMGVRIALDDFGTGYSSLAYLRRFPIDEIKIDKSFVRDIDSTSGAASLVQAIIGIARSLDLGVVAEGVETPAQHRFLRKHGCDRMQGYLFSRPLPAEEMVRLLSVDVQFAAGETANRSDDA
jgi:diguanylate cyclase (GGDEF)-like protein/PAS domain S-box-containing protein